MSSRGPGIDVTGNSDGSTEACALCFRFDAEIAISASKVEALCEIKRGLLDMGVPEEASD